jgi:NTE family protein
MLPRILYLCGGGVNTVAHIGVLEELQKEGYLQLVREWAGVSAGAMLAMCLSTGFTLPECREFMVGFDFREVTDPDEAPGWLVHFGFDTGNRLLRLAEVLLRQKGFAPTATFDDLHKQTHIRLRIYATDLNTGELLEYSAAKTPTYCVAHAVRASMSIPYYFQPFRCPVTNHMLADGGVYSNFPLHTFSSRELRDTLAVAFLNSTDTKEELEVMDLCMRPVSVLTTARTPADIRPFLHQTICVQIGARSPVHFEINEKERTELVEQGRLAVREYFLRARKPVRRYSVS